MVLRKMNGTASKLILRLTQNLLSQAVPPSLPDCVANDSFPQNHACSERFYGISHNLGQFVKIPVINTMGMISNPL